MEQTIIKVDGMSCDHCVKCITETLSALNGVSGVVVSLENNTVTVDHNSAVTVDLLASEIEDIGYDVV